MTVGQAVLWAATDVDPKYENPELTTSEPYVMGSHATGCGAWCSGPEDVSPPEYYWGYNRMTTVEGLFGAGDAVGGTPHTRSHPDPSPKVDWQRRPRVNTLTTAKLKALWFPMSNLKNAKKKSTSRWKPSVSIAMRLLPGLLIRTTSTRVRHSIDCRS